MHSTRSYETAVAQSVAVQSDEPQSRTELHSASRSKIVLVLFLCFCPHVCSIVTRSIL